MPATTRPFDPANYLEPDEAMAAYISEALDYSDPEFIVDAPGVIERARRMTNVARDADLAREGLYRTRGPAVASGSNIIYQLEVKRSLTAFCFPVAEGWDVTVDIALMERGENGQHLPEKTGIARECETWPRECGVQIVRHAVYGRPDLVASKAGFGTFVIEVEEDSSKQMEQAMYSAF